MNTAAHVSAAYAARAAEWRERRVREARTLDRLGNLRLAVFLAAALLVAQWATSATHRAAWLAAALLATALFATLVRLSGRARERLQHTDDRITLADEGGHRVARAWGSLPVRDPQGAPAGHPYAADLDVFGEASLAQLLPPMSVVPGHSTLREWLLAPADPTCIRARQQAVDELRAQWEFRDELVMAGRRVTVNAEGASRLTQWAAAEGWLLARPGLIALSIAIPGATIALIAAQAAGVVAQAYWMVPLLAGLALSARHGKALSASFAPVVGRATILRRYARMARLAADAAFQSPALVSLQQRLTAPPRAAHAAMRALTSLADCTELRLSPMLYFAVNTLTLWDFHVAHLLERWQRTSGRHVGDWMKALGELESLSALATLAFENPDWTFPEFSDRRSATVEAEGVGHPLLAADAGVRNDVRVGPAGTILVVTGSNMAGKSTLLRSLGLNLVLSQAGSVVCARRFVHPPATLHTSMRVQDSLERGVSYFMAELERLKAVVDAADAVPPDGPRVLVYLLDEILHGTNSAERTIAARHVLTHLVSTGAIGAVTTHDLQLVDAPELAAAARHVHFRERFSRVNGAPSMTFDYQLRPGKATSSNALKLLELVGLKPPD